MTKRVKMTVKRVDTSINNWEISREGQMNLQKMSKAKFPRNQNKVHLISKRRMAGNTKIKMENIVLSQLGNDARLNDFKLVF